MTEEIRPDEPTDRASTPGPVGPLPPAPAGPPGAGIFGLDRPAPGLYAVAWLLLVAGLGLALVGLFSSSQGSAAILLLLGFAALGGSLLFAVGYQLVARRGRLADAYHGPAPLLVLGVVVFGAFVLTAILLVAGIPDPTQSSAGALLDVLVIALLYLACVWFMVVRTGALTWTDMGWPTAAAGRRPSELLADIGIGVALVLPIYVVAEFAAVLLAAMLGVHMESTLPMPTSATEALSAVVAAIVVAPLGEEMFFRGFSLTAWRRDLGARSALIRSSLLFAAMHVLNVTTTNASEGVRLALIQFLVILPVSFGLGWLFVRRGIVASIAGHMAFNGVGVLLILAAATRLGS